MPRIDDILRPIMAQLRNNPNIQGNPTAQGMMDVLESGDSKRGEELAKNLCESMGISQKDAVKQAKDFFGIK